MNSITPLYSMYGLEGTLFPMNAVKATPEKLEFLMESDDYWAELKWDGSRYTTAEGRFFSRTPSEDKSKPELMGFPVEKTDQVPHLSAIFEQLPGIWLDGEIYIGGRSDDVVSILGCDPAKAIARQQESGRVSYILFDVLCVDYRSVMHQPFEVRRMLLEQIFEENKELFDDLKAEFGCEIILSKVCKTAEEKRALKAYVDENKLEGMVFKNRHKEYRPDKRLEHYWYKDKKGIEADVVISGFIPGKGKFEGLIGSIEFSQYKLLPAGQSTTLKPPLMAVIDGKIHTLEKCGKCSGMDDSFRKVLTDNQADYIGKVIRITAMERTKAGQFRHPQFDIVREDKTANMCIWGEC